MTAFFVVKDLDQMTVINNMYAYLLTLLETSSGHAM